MLIEVAKRQISGIIHLAGPTRISRYETAELVAEKLHLDKKLLNPVKISDMKWTAKRPKDSSLDISKASSLLIAKPLSLEEGLNDFFQETKNNYSGMADK